MIELKNLTLKEIVPQAELQAWRSKIKIDIEDCPVEVRQYIEALATKLGDFAQIRKKEYTYLIGEELLLCGMKEINGEAIDRWTSYPTPIPYMVAVDHRSAMYRIFKRRGKQGLIDFTKAKVKGTELEKLCKILNVEVFKEERIEFVKVLEDINNAKKIDSIL